MTLGELQAKLGARGVKVGLATLWRVFERRGITLIETAHERLWRDIQGSPIFTAKPNRWPGDRLDKFGAVTAKAGGQNWTLLGGQCSTLIDTLTRCLACRASRQCAFR